MKKALFLDRDGVINKEKNYLYKIEDFEFIDGVFETTKHFQELGYLIIVITNQAGIARGKYTEEDFDALTQWMKERFKEHDVVISEVYHCPHHPNFSKACNCRKPNPGMLLSAKEKFDIDMKNSILVGDKESDIQAGINAGIKKNYLITTGHSLTENKFHVPIINNLKDLMT